MAVELLVLCFCGTRITVVCNRLRGDDRKIGGISREVGERGEGREGGGGRLHN